MQINPSMCTSVVFSPWLQHSRVPCGSEVWSIGVIQSINHSSHSTNQSINQSINQLGPSSLLGLDCVCSLGFVKHLNSYAHECRQGIQAKQAGSASCGHPGKTGWIRKLVESQAPTIPVSIHKAHQGLSSEKDAAPVVGKAECTSGDRFIGTITAIQ